MATWQVQDAQARRREGIDTALSEGPQTIIDNGVSVIVLSEGRYRLLVERKPTFEEHLLGGPKDDGFIDFVLSGPKVDDFTFERAMDTGQDFEFDSDEDVADQHQR